MDLLHALSTITWHTVRLSLQNSRNTFAREHPLSIFHAIFLSAANGGALKKNSFFHPLDKLPNRVRKNEVYDLELVFPTARLEEINSFTADLDHYLADPSRNFRLSEIHPPQARSLAHLEEEHAALAGTTELCLNFLTPFPFKPKDKRRRWLVDRDLFFRSLLNRVQRFFDLDLPDSAKAWQQVRLLPYYWEYEEYRHRSKSSQGEQYINGMTGPLYLRGDVTQVMPLLLVCAELHGGRRLAAGQGYYRLAKEHGFFDPQLADSQRFQDLAKSLEQNSDLADDLAMHFLDKPRALGQLHGDIVAGYPRPGVAKGFYIDKRRQGQRLIATLELNDYLVHKFLLSILSPVLDRMFEEASVGFRVGRSRETAREMIRTACNEGFCYVLESDIESFYDRIDWEFLEKKLAEALPMADRLTLRLLAAVIRQPLEINGKREERNMGLVQGSPLSPLLSNLYLDSFDEEMEERGFRLIRYADDLLVLVRNREEMELALAAICEILAALKLGLKEEKTTSTPIEFGFSFLGLSFDAGMDEDFIADAALRKTLFIRNQYSFVGVDGDSVVVRKEGLLLARLPIKRISEIVVFGTNTVSSMLMQKCSWERIPVSFCSPMGYYQGTLRPDSKSHFLLAASHANRHAALDEAELQKMAAQIVTAKLHNYLSWFKDRWAGESREICSHVETSLASLAKADSIEKIRGYEGEAARHIFAFVNSRCADPAFHVAHRRKRLRQDPFNSLLDFVYTLLFTRLNVLLRNRGLNPYLGILHSHKDNFESLVCDLQEPFRCRMDRFVVKCINRKVIKGEDFELTDYGKIQLNFNAVGHLLEAFEREQAVRLAGDNGTLKQLLVAQVRAVESWAEGQDELLLYQASGERGIGPRQTIAEPEELDD